MGNRLSTRFVSFPPALWLVGVFLDRTQHLDSTFTQFTFSRVAIYLMPTLRAPLLALFFCCRCWHPQASITIGDVVVVSFLN